MEIIKVENLSTIFGENIVHNNISFSINEKEIFGVLGGSGSGKTVLIKQIVMLSGIQKGSIKIFDKDISNLNLEQSQEVKQQFSYLFQFGALFSFLTVIENIAVMLKEYTNLPNDLIEKIAYTNLEIKSLALGLNFLQVLLFFSYHHLFQKDINLHNFLEVLQFLGLYMLFVLLNH